MEAGKNYMMIPSRNKLKWKTIAKKIPFLAQLSFFFAFIFFISTGFFELPVFAAQSVAISSSRIVFNGNTANTKLNTRPNPATLTVEIAYRIDTLCNNPQLVINAPAALEYISCTSNSSVLNLTPLENGAGVIVHLRGNMVGTADSISAQFKLRDDVKGFLPNGTNIGRIAIQLIEGGVIVNTINQNDILIDAYNNSTATLNKQYPTGDLRDGSSVTIQAYFRRTDHFAWRLEPDSTVDYEVTLPSGVILTEPPNGFTIVSGDGNTTPVVLQGSFPASEWNSVDAANALLYKSITFQLIPGVYAPAQGAFLVIPGFSIQVRYQLSGEVDKRQASQSISLTVSNPEPNMAPATHTSVVYWATNSGGGDSYLSQGGSGSRGSLLLGNTTNTKNKLMLNVGTAPFYGMHMKMTNGAGNLRAPIATVAILARRYASLVNDVQLYGGLDAITLRKDLGDSYLALGDFYVKYLITWVDSDGQKQEVWGQTPPFNKNSADNVAITHTYHSMPLNNPSMNNTNNFKLPIPERGYIESVEAWPVWNGIEGELPPTFQCSVHMTVSWPNQTQVQNSTFYNYRYLFPDGTPPTNELVEFTGEITHIQDGELKRLPLDNSGLPMKVYFAAPNNVGRVTPVAGTYSARPGDTITIPLELYNLATQGATTSWKNIGIIADIPSQTLEFVGIEPQNPADYPNGLSYDVVDGADKGRQNRSLIRIHANSQDVEITPQAAAQRPLNITFRIKSGAANGSYTAANGLRFYAYSYGEEKSIAPYARTLISANIVDDSVYDLDDNPLTTELICSHAATASLGFSVLVHESLLYSTHIQGDYPGDPEIKIETGAEAAAKILPGGQGSFKLRIENIGNQAVSNIRLLDILPHYADYKVNSSGGLVSRGSMWTPTFSSLKVEVFKSDGTKKTLNGSEQLQFTDEKNPDRKEIDTSWTGGNITTWINENAWTLTYSDIAAFLYHFGNNTLTAGEYIEIVGGFYAPQGTPYQVDILNSFGVTYKFTSQPQASAEPMPGRYQIVDTGRAQVGSFVFFDGNGNHIHDIDESGVNDLEVELYRQEAGGGFTLLKSQKTINSANGSRGYYCFSDLDPGIYKVKFILPASLQSLYRFVDKDVDVATNAFAASRANPLNGETDAFVLEAGYTRFDINAGLKTTASGSTLKGILYNGALTTRDDGDTAFPIGGAMVKLYRSINNGLAYQLANQCTTSQSGFFEFPGLSSGNNIVYRLEYFAPAGMIFSENNQAILQKSNLTPSDSVFHSFALSVPGGAGMITGRVWLDINKDGVMDANEGEGIISAIEVRDKNDNFVTGANCSGNQGNYFIPNLPPLNAGEKYKLRFYYNPVMYLITPKVKAGGNQAEQNNDTERIWGEIEMTSLSDKEIKANQNVGLTTRDTSALTILAFQDENGNARLDSGELTFIQGVSIVLSPVGNTVDTDTKITNGFGNAVFGDKPIDAYNLTLTAPNGYEIVPEALMFRSAERQISHVIASDGTITGLELERNASATLYLPLQNRNAKISGVCWYDDNGDGIKNANESFSALQAVLCDASGQQITAVSAVSSSAATGIYSFSDLPGGNYTVRIYLPTDDSSVTYSFSGVTGNGKENCMDETGLSAEFTAKEGATVTETNGISCGVKRRVDVSFDLQGYGGSTPTSITGLSYASLVPSKPGDPIEEGYDFVGWYKEANCTTIWNFDVDKVTAHTTLYANWTVHPCFVFFSGDAGDGNLPDPQEVLYGQSIDASTLNITKTGYNLTGWFTDDAYTVEWTLTDQVFDDLTLHPKWEKQEYAVCFDTGGGTEISLQTIKYCEYAQRPDEDPSQSGYAFIGWFDDVSGGNAWEFDMTAITAPVTIYAQWQPIQYTVTYDLNYLAAPANQSENVIFDTALSAPISPSRNGYTFGGWYNNSACTGSVWSFGDYRYPDDLTLYAKWSVISYSFIFNANAPDASVSGLSATQTVPFESKAAQPLTQPTRTGYDFCGWYKESGCTNLWNFEMDIVTSETTVYAEWALSYYTVSYDANGGDPAYLPEDLTDYIYGSSAVILSADGILHADTPETMMYGGWNTEPDGSGIDYAEDADLLMYENVTLFVKWRPVGYMSYHTNGGEGTPPEDFMPYEPGEYISIMGGGSLTKTGYHFEGWNTKADGSGQMLLENDLYKMPISTPHLVLYAYWEPYLYTLDYNVNGADSGDPPAQVIEIYGKLIGIEGNIGGLERAGYDFSGWGFNANDVSGYAAGEQFVMPDNDITLYAIWIPIQLHQECDLLALNIGSENAAIQGLSVSISLPYQNMAYAIEATASFGADVSFWADASCSLNYGEELNCLAPDMDMVFYVRVQAEEPTVSPKMYIVTVAIQPIREVPQGSGENPQDSNNGATNNGTANNGTGNNGATNNGIANDTDDELINIENGLDSPAAHTITLVEPRQSDINDFNPKPSKQNPRGPLYSYRTLLDQPTGVSITGYFTVDASICVTVAILHETGRCSACDEIRARQEAGEVVILQDISIVGGYQGDIEVSIPVGVQYNGQRVQILHCADGTLEIRTAVVESGNAIGRFSSLSPFAVTRANRTIVSGLPDNYRMHVGDSVSWTPMPEGGTWSFDDDCLSMTMSGDQYTFHARKEGVTAAIYTVNGISHTVSIIIIISISMLPQTGDAGNIMLWLIPVMVMLCGVTAIYFNMAVAVRFKRKK